MLVKLGSNRSMSGAGDNAVGNGFRPSMQTQRHQPPVSLSRFSSGAEVHAWSLERTVANSTRRPLARA